MSNETIADLRAHLFSTLSRLTNKDDPLDIERAKAVADIAQTIINTAKVEVEHMKIAGGQGSGFIPSLANDAPRGAQIAAVAGGRVITHRLAG